MKLLDWWFNHYKRSSCAEAQTVTALSVTGLDWTCWDTPVFTSNRDSTIVQLITCHAFTHTHTRSRGCAFHIAAIPFHRRVALWDSHIQTEKVREAKKKQEYFWVSRYPEHGSSTTHHTLNPWREAECAHDPASTTLDLQPYLRNISFLFSFFFLLSLFQRSKHWGEVAKTEESYKSVNQQWHFCSSTQQWIPPASSIRTFNGKQKKKTKENLITIKNKH